MIYLVGGPPRCGKTELALRLGLPFVSTDLLWDVLALTQHDMRESMQHSPDRVATAAKRFRPFLDAAVRSQAWTFPDFVVEGEVIRPRDAGRLKARAVFLVRTHATLEELTQPPGHGPWMLRQPAPVVEAVIHEVVAYSAQLQRECAALGLPCIDVAGRFEAAMAEAAAALRY